MVAVTDGDDRGNDEDECRKKEWGPESWKPNTLRGRKLGVTMVGLTAPRSSSRTETNGHRDGWSV